MQNKQNAQASENTKNRISLSFEINNMHFK